MSGFKIETGVPMPSQSHRRVRGYPFADMGVGDSFFVAAEGGETLKVVQSRLSAALARQCRRNGWKYVTRQVDGGVRGWRVE